ncbi:MAG: ribonuclease HI family protein, partial [Bacteroidota bacterium]
ASRGNPGESGIGIILRDAKGNMLFSGSGYLGKVTNNEAEYNALLLCLKKIKSVLMGRDRAKSTFEKVIVYSDSELLVNQMRGLYRVKDEQLRRMFRRAARLIQSLPVRVEIRHVTREQNLDADMLANYGIETRIKLRV